VKLQNPHLAIIDRRKIVEYLLNPGHPDNNGKAGFFEALGFSTDTADALIDELRALAVSGEVVKRVETVHGEKYVVDGLLSLHTQTSPAWMVRTVWIIDNGRDAPRLVTVYPR
jgi:hypothetical protein